MQQTELGLNLSVKRPLKRKFPMQMQPRVSWATLAAHIASYALEGEMGRPPFGVETMLRSRCMRRWVALNDPAPEDARHDIELLGGLSVYSTNTEFRGAAISWSGARWPSRYCAPSTIHCVARDGLPKAGTVVDATLIATPSLTKNPSGERDTEGP